MANTLVSTFSYGISQAKLTKPNTGLASTTWTDGTGVNKLTFSSVNGAAAVQGADEIYKSVLTIAGSGSATLDIRGTTLFNPVGDAIAFVRVKAMLIELLSPDQDSSGTLAASILVGKAASAPAFEGTWLAGTDPQIRIYNGGFLQMGQENAAGVTVGAAASDLLKIANEDGALSAKVRITLIGSKS